MIDDKENQANKAATDNQELLDANAADEATVDVAETPSAETEEIDAVKALADKDKEIQEGVDRLKRLQADFDNFRRRTRQEKEELSAVVAQGLIKDLLPLLDNFERALAIEETAEQSSIREGVEMIYKQLVASLEKNGLERIVAVGQKFDPNYHEAVMRVADESLADDMIAEELQSGYLVRGRVIRPTMVKVVAN